MLLLAVFVAFGFYKPFFSMIPHFDAGITPLVLVHATALMLFVALLVAQPLLVRYKKREVHRIIGRITYVLMPVILATCIGVIFKEYGEGLQRYGTPAAALRYVYSDAAQLLLLMVFYALAILNRKNIPVHMRYMIAVALIIAPAGIARVLGYWFDVPRFQSGLSSYLFLDAVLVALILFDRGYKLSLRPYMLVLTCFVVFQAGYVAVAH